MPSYRLRVVQRFEAAHHLTAYHGAPEPVHGHSWRVEAVLHAAELNAESMAYDFVPVQAALRELVGMLDHRDLNSVAPFAGTSPTTERIAAWFYEGLRRLLPGAEVAEVTVWEGPECAATFLP